VRPRDAIDGSEIQAALFSFWQQCCCDSSPDSNLAFSIFLAVIQPGATNLNCGNGLNAAERAMEFHVIYSFASKSIQWIM
jgi:hypothetical protein